jgi:hypothetical protein
VRDAVAGDLFPEYADVENLRHGMEPERDSGQLSRRSAHRNPGSPRAPAQSLNAPGTSIEVPVPVLKFSVFHGYPAELIAQWCGVDRATATLWKQNKRKASRQALRLFTLHRDGQILGDAWRGWGVRDDKIFDPDGYGTTEPQLRGYCIMMQYAAELARRDPQEQERFFALLAQG